MILYFPVGYLTTVLSLCIETIRDDFGELVEKLVVQCADSREQIELQNVNCNP